MGNSRGMSRKQLFLAPCLEYTTEENNAFRVIAALVETMDLEKLGFIGARPSFIGRLSNSSADIMKLYLYGYLHGNSLLFV